MIHLSLLVWKLSSAKRRSFIHHVRRAIFGIASIDIIIQKRSNQRTLELSSPPDVDRKSRPRNLSPQLEVNQPILSSQFPMRKLLSRQIRLLPSFANYFILLRGPSLRH